MPYAGCAHTLWMGSWFKPYLLTPTVLTEKRSLHYDRTWRIWPTTYLILCTAYSVILNIYIYLTHSHMPCTKHIQTEYIGLQGLCITYGWSIQSLHITLWTKLFPAIKNPKSLHNHHTKKKHTWPISKPKATNCTRKWRKKTFNASPCLILILLTI